MGKIFLFKTGDDCFNPCSGGLWLLRVVVRSHMVGLFGSFNPCSGGLWLLRG